MDAVVEIMTERPAVVVVLVLGLVGLLFASKLLLFRLLGRVLGDAPADPDQPSG